MFSYWLLRSSYLPLGMTLLGECGTLVTIVHNAHVGNTYALARSHTGDFLFTGGEDGAIHMYEICCAKIRFYFTKE